MSLKTLIIIPVYNEERSIGEVIDSAKKHYPEADILTVIDGATDNSSLIAKEKNIFVIDLPYNLGIGSAMQIGFQFAKLKNYDIAVQVDADGQHDPQFILDLIQALMNRGLDMVIGSRFYSDSNYRAPFARRLGIRLFSGILSMIVNQRVSDATSGFRAINKRTITLFSENYPEDYPEVESILLLYKLGFKFLEMSVKMSQRKGGRSSITPLKSVYYILKVMLSIFISLFRKEDHYGGYANG